MTEAQGTGPYDAGRDADRPRPAPPAAGAVADLRAAASALDALDGTDDPGEHADRFEAVHDALVAVLADVDRT